jgi:hypothetical protein
MRWAITSIYTALAVVWEIQMAALADARCESYDLRIHVKKENLAALQDYLLIEQSWSAILIGLWRS